MQPEPKAAEPVTRIERARLAAPAVGLFHRRPLELVVALGDECVVVELTAADAAALALSLISGLAAPAPAAVEHDALRQATAAGHA